MADKLDVIFDMQRKLNGYIIEKRGLQNITNEEWIQKQALAMISELSETLDEVNFKWWKNPKPVDSLALKNELVDILHFLVSMFLSAGMDADEVLKLYLDKNEENFKRQFGTSAKKGYGAGE